MEFKFNLDKQLKDFYGIDAKNVSQKAVRFMRRNIRGALRETLKMVRLCTPHAGDGKPRGPNMITNSLYNSWHANYTPFDSGSKLGYLVLSNSRPYAKYVQYGHRVTRHFVPWLYIGNNGLIGRETNHSGKLFGLTVGVPERYVPGVDMTSMAVQTFTDAVLRSIFAAELYQYSKESKKRISESDMALTEMKGHYYDDKADMSERRQIAKIYSDIKDKAVTSMKEFLKSLFK